MIDNKQQISDHRIILQNRNELNLSGVLDVVSFDEQMVVLKTSMGELTVKGEGLKVNSFATETGDLNIEGNVCAFAYTSGGNKKSIASRLFG